jgi:hypothetical protein
MRECGTRVNGGTIAGVPFKKAIDLAITTLNPRAPSRLNRTRREEPPWQKPKTLLDLATDFKFSNQKQINAAFGYGFRVFDDLPKFRNFFAHRNEETSGKAQRLGPAYGVPSTWRPWRILAASAIGRPQAIILDWFDEIRRTGEDLCE